jgi:hypothetical protein
MLKKDEFVQLKSSREKSHLSEGSPATGFQAILPNPWVKAEDESREENRKRSGNKTTKRTFSD